MREMRLQEDLSFAELVADLRDPATAGRRGDTVYLLRSGGHDCSSIVPELIRCVASGSFEEAVHATFILERTEADVSDDHVCTVRAELQLAALGAAGWRAELIEDALGMLDGTDVG